MKQPIAFLAARLASARIGSMRFLAGIGANFQARTPLADLIETMRGLAVLLLLGFHVIGANPSAGLRLDYPHPARFCRPADRFANALVRIHRWLCVRVAADPLGRVRQLRHRQVQAPGNPWDHRHPSLRACPTASGKDSFAVQAGGLWRLFLFPYAHYWFLQTILLIFLIHGTIKLLTGNRRTALLLGLAFCAIAIRSCDTAGY